MTQEKLDINNLYIDGQDYRKIVLKLNREPTDEEYDRIQKAINAVIEEMDE